MDGPSELRLWREAHKLSQAQVAEALRGLGAGKTSAASVCEWEKDGKTPRMEAAVAIQALTEGEVPTTAWGYPAITLVPDPADVAPAIPEYLDAPDATTGEHAIPADDSAAVPGERPSLTGTDGG